MINKLSLISLYAFSSLAATFTLLVFFRFGHFLIKNNFKLLAISISLVATQIYSLILTSVFLFSRKTKANYVWLTLLATLLISSSFFFLTGYSFDNFESYYFRQYVNLGKSLRDNWGTNIFYLDYENVLLSVFGLVFLIILEASIFVQEVLRKNNA